MNSYFVNSYAVLFYEIASIVMFNNDSVYINTKIHNQNINLKKLTIFVIRQQTTSCIFIQSITPYNAHRH